MHFGSIVATACLSFVLTNIDDAFVLVTFFAEATTSKNLTPLKIIIGQYVGFTIIVAISLIGFALAMAIPSQPIGFLGLLPLLLGVWRLLGLLFPAGDGVEEEESESKRIADAKSILKVASVTVMNGGDNIGTYVPLFSQANGAEIAVYVVVYYILLGIWCLVAFLVMRQKHVLRLAKQYIQYFIPFLYMGLGTYIVVKSDCYPWSIGEINKHFQSGPGLLIMGVVTALLLSFVIAFMVWNKLWRQNRKLATHGEISLVTDTLAVADNEAIAAPAAAIAENKAGDAISTAELDHADRGPAAVTEKASLSITILNSEDKPVL